MKIAPVFAAVFLLQTISAVSTETEKSNTNSQLDTVEDQMTQELLKKYIVFRWEINNTFAQESFEFQLNEPTILQVVDFKYHGDMFDVYDKGQSIGSTSKVAYDEDNEAYAATPQDALEDDHFSKGSFSLDKGQHNITILAHGPYDTGSAAIRLVQRTNLVVAKNGQGQSNMEEQKTGVEQEEEEEEGGGDEHDKKEKQVKEHASVEKNDQKNWKKVFLQKKTDSKDGHKKQYFKHSDGFPRKKQQYKYHQNHGRPAYHKASYNGPKTITHWETVRITAIPYATKVMIEKDKY